MAQIGENTKVSTDLKFLYKFYCNDSRFGWYLL